MPYKREGSSYWWSKYTDAQGRRVRRSTKTSDYKEACAVEARWKLEAYRQHTWGEAPRYTFEQLAASYLRETTAKRSHERDGYSIKRLAEYFRYSVLADITPADITEYKRSRAVSDSTIAKELRLFSAMLNHARKEWGWDVANVVKGRIPKEPEGKLRWLTREEYARLVACASPRYVAQIIRLTVYAGLRKGEALGLTWDRVDFGHNLLYLTPATQKSGKHGSVPLAREAIEVLRERVGIDSEYVFTIRDRPIGSIKKAFRSSCERAGLHDVTPHTLRHTTAAWLIQSGVPLRTVCEIMRHASITTTMRYAHLSPDSARQGIEALDVYQNVPHERQNQAFSGTNGHTLKNRRG